MPALRERMVRCKRPSHGARCAGGQAWVIVRGVYTVIPWFAARRARKSLGQMLQAALTDQPTLLAIVADKYTSEEKLRPFAPLAERFAGRLHVILAAEWEQEDREREGDAALRQLRVAPEARRRSTTCWSACRPRRRRLRARCSPASTTSRRQACAGSVARAARPSPPVRERSGKRGPRGTASS